MSKRKWPDHPAVGRTILINCGQGPVEVKVVDVKCGPMMVDLSTFARPDAKITGTLCLRIKYPGGHESWTPPMDGEELVRWCEQQNVLAAREGGAS